MSKSRRTLLALACAVVTACGGDDDDGGAQVAGGGDRTVAVMTRNLFLGTGLDVLSQGVPALNVPATVRRLFDEVNASNPPERMARIAEEIAAARPDLVGLQEAAIYTTRLLPATTPRTDFDFAQLVLSELARRGVAYRIVDGATATNFSQELPDDTGRVIGFTDRDVLLARDGVATRDPANGRFAQLLSVSVGGFTATVPRGWGAATADVNGATIRVFNAHLEAIGDPAGTREAQARELATIASAVALPVLLLGDFNSPPTELAGAYGILRDGGFAEAWERLRPGEAGVTCCFATTLRESDALETRIDLVLFRGAFTPLSAEVVGEEPGDRTASGLRPSDHAGAVATLRAP